MKNDEELTNSNLMPNNSSSILGNSVHPPLMTKKSRTISIKESHTNDIILEALTRQRKEVFSLEKDLYGCLNLQWGEDIITEDIPITCTY